MLLLSFSQRRLWFVHRFEGPSASHNLPLVLRVTGTLDRLTLTEAVRDVVIRHQSLRTVFGADDGEPYQSIVPPGRLHLDVPVIEVAAEPESEVVDRVIAHPFDLAVEIPIRVSLLDRGAGQHLIVVLLHHIAADGASAAVLVRDLSTAYNARRSGSAPDWADLPVQYTDFTLWQRELLGGDDDPDSLLSRQLRYWRAELAGVPQPLGLATDRPRPSMTSGRGDTVPFRLEPELLARVEDLPGPRASPSP